MEIIRTDDITNYDYLRIWTINVGDNIQVIMNMTLETSFNKILCDKLPVSLWWRHNLEVLSASLFFCVEQALVTSELPSVIRLNNILNKQSSCW